MLVEEAEEGLFEAGGVSEEAGEHVQTAREDEVLLVDGVGACHDVYEGSCDS